MGIIYKNGVSYGGGSGGGDNSKDITLAEYQNLTEEEKNNGTNYFITDATVENPDIVGTAGTIKQYEYSEEDEVVIGIYKGRPLYRKTFTLTNSGVKTFDFDTGIESMYNLVNCHGYELIGGAMIPFGAYVNSSRFSTVYFIFPSTLRFVFGENCTGVTCVIEYTKTTDEADSGRSLMPYGYVSSPSNNYSTNEQVIGRWIDGKPLYQKTISSVVNWTPSLRSPSVAHNISNLDKTVHIEALLGAYPLPYLGGQTVDTYVRNIDGQNINFENHNTWSGYELIVTLQYTKTTD